MLSTADVTYIAPGRPVRALELSVSLRPIALPAYAR